MPNSFGGVSYLGFEKLTFVPIQVYHQLDLILFFVETYCYNGIDPHFTFLLMSNQVLSNLTLAYEINNLPQNYFKDW